MANDVIIAKVITDSKELDSLGFGQFQSLDCLFFLHYVEEKLICNVNDSILTISDFKGNVYNLDEIVFECLKILFPKKD